MSVAAPAGWNVNAGAGGAADSPDVEPGREEAHAASAPGATNPTARAVKARRLLTDGTDGTGSAGLTWTEDT